MSIFPNRLNQSPSSKECFSLIWSNSKFDVPETLPVIFYYTGLSNKGKTSPYQSLSPL